MESSRNPSTPPLTSIATPVHTLPTTPRARSESVSDKTKRASEVLHKQVTPPVTPRERRFSFFKTPSKATSSAKRRSSLLGWMLASPETPSNKQKAPVTPKPFMDNESLKDLSVSDTEETMKLSDFLETVNSCADPIFRSTSGGIEFDIESKELKEFQELSMSPRYAEGTVHPYNQSENLARKLFHTEEGTPSSPDWILSPILYSELAKVILDNKSSNDAFKQVQKKFILYENELNPDKAKNKNCDTRKQAIKAAATDCLITMKNYQVISKEKQFLEVKGNLVLDLQLQRMIEHIESSYPLQVNLRWNEKLQLLNELQQTLQALDDTNTKADDIEWLKHIRNLVKHACSYEKIYGDHAIMKKVRGIIKSYKKKLSESAQKNLRAFYDTFGNNIIVDLAFSGERLCSGMHKSICEQLDKESASENYLFLDRLQIFLKELHSSYQQGSLTKKMPTFFEEIKMIYQVYIGKSQLRPRKTITESDDPSVKIVNLAGNVHKVVTNKFTELEAEYRKGEIDQEKFYQLASTLFLPAQEAIKKLIYDALKRLKDHDRELAKPIFLQEFLKSISAH